MGKLIVVPTPIGNLKDITLRALEVLKQVEVIACEDTRRTSRLLNHFNIQGKKLISYYEPVERRRIPKILSLLREKDVALVSDAGMPSISDPGFLLIRRCVDEGIEVEVLPGPSSPITALVGSGLPTDRFIFFGFLPRKGLKRYIENLKNYEGFTLIFFESPTRILKTLGLFEEVFPDSDLCVARELTKIHEEYLRGKPGEILKHLKAKKRIKGELILLARLNHH